MNSENSCLGCGRALPDGALGGLCPVCLLRQGLNGEDSDAEPTGSLAKLTHGPLTPGMMAVLTEACGSGPIPQTLLRDTDPGPLVLPGSPEMPAVGDRTGRLQLLGEIARGGMGAVLKGRDPDLGRDLAVKVLLESHRDKPELIRRFIEEAQIGGQLQHPGIVPIYELGAFADRRPYFAMKLVKGRTLSSLIDERPDPARDLSRFLAIFEQVCQTMAYAHARGVIHRDLKPSNIMVGSFGEVQVMDWGLAKVLPQGGAVDDASAGKTRDRDTVIATVRSGSDTHFDRSRAGSVLGTPSYMAPEQARGETDLLDERCDVFALGSILCELLTSSPAFTGRSSGEIQRKASRGDLKESLSRLDDCGADAELIALAKDCLAPELEDRPRHAGAVAERMMAHRTGVEERLRRTEIARAEEKARAEEATKRARVERDRLRLTVALAASVLGLLLVIGGGSVYLARQRAARRAETEHEVSKALDEAILHRGQAQAAAVVGLSKWTEAIEAANKARSILSAGEPDKALSDRVDGLLVVLGREQSEAAHRAAEVERDRKFLERLAVIELEPRARHELGAKWADSAYSAAFREFGIDLDKGDPTEAGRILASRSVPTDLAHYLHDWVLQLQYVPDTKERQIRLIKTADAADPDPWRCKVRKHLVDWDYETVRHMATDEKTLSAQPASGLLLLASILMESPYFKGGGAITRRLLQRAWQLQPDSFLVCNTLGSYQGYAEDQGNEDLNVRFCTAAVALRPSCASAHNRLAHELVTLHDPKPEFRDHILLPAVTEKLPEAIAELREAVRLRPEVGSFHGDLGSALFLAEGGYGEAVEEYRKAAKLDPEPVQSFMFRVELAYSILNAGRPIEAISELRETLRLSKDPIVVEYGPETGEEHLSEFERLAELERRLPTILRGQNVPADAEDKLGIARLCRAKRYFAAAARFYREAFQAKPALAEDLTSQYRLHAAIAAARAGTDLNSPKDIRPLEGAERARWRAQALAWLRGEEEACAKAMETAIANQPQANRPPNEDQPILPLVRNTLDILTHHRDLACVREESELKKLPEVERKAWQAFWAEVAALLKKAEPS